MVISLIVAQMSTLAKAPWKFNAFWFQLFTSPEELEGSIQRFLTAQHDSESVFNEWEAFKTYLRRILSTEVNKVKKHSEALREALELQVHSLKVKYVQDPTESAKGAWQSAQSVYEHLLASSVEKRRFFSKTAFFEEGETTGRLLARIANSELKSPVTGTIKNAGGSLSALQIFCTVLPGRMDLRSCLAIWPRSHSRVLLLLKARN